MAQLTLEQIGTSTWLIPGLVNIGVVVRDGKAILIDSGNDKEAGRQINKRIAEQGWELTAVVNTHSNADHIGGNAFLQNKTNCRIAASPGEAPFIERPELEAAFLYGGFPYPGLDNKFLKAAPSKVTDIIPGSGPVVLGNGRIDTGLEAIPLPGHYFDMIGLRTPDNILFLGDALFSEHIINKYHLFFIYDVAGYLNTLDRIGEMTAELFVPSHARPADNILPLIDVNRRKIDEIAAVIADLCSPSAEFGDILAGTCKRYGIQLDANQYVLIGSTVRSYLSYLAGNDRVRPRWNGSGMLWAAE